MVSNYYRIYKEFLIYGLGEVLFQTFYTITAKGENILKSAADSVIL